MQAIQLSHRSNLNKRFEESYDEQAANTYREHDARDIRTPASRQVIEHLRQLSAQFPDKINVLDIGCGTGRFFHALYNVDELTGIDLSAPMLAAAKKPVNEDRLDIGKIKLIHGDYLSAKLPQQGFDLIYAIGVFGHPAPITKEVLDHFYKHLAPGGSLFFTIADPNDESYHRAFHKSLARRLVERSFRFLPSNVQAYFNERWQRYFISQTEMETLFEDSQFRCYRTWPMVSRFIACEAMKS